jgi:probable F420-dependent oxidoreductase
MTLCYDFIPVPMAADSRGRTVVRPPGGTVRIGGPLPWSGHHSTRDNLRTFVQEIELAGYEWVTAGEHLFYPKDLRTPHPRSGKLSLDPTQRSHEIFTLFAWLAASTSTLKFMSSMVIVPYRSPFVTAKLAAGVDYLSDGRLILGCAGGWMEEEFHALHLPFAERGAITDEFLEVISAIFAGEGTVDGRFSTLPEAWIEPKPVQRPLPLIIGGRDVAPVLRRVARFGHGWWPYPMNAEQIGAAVPRMRELWMAAARVEEMQVHCYLRVPLDRETGARQVSREELLAQAGDLAAAGVTHLTMTFDELGTADGGPAVDAVLDAVRWFAAEVMPDVKAIG